MMSANNDRQQAVEVHNIGSYTFRQTGESTRSDDMGMREMQRRAYAKRTSQYLLIQAPPACGKSRALMFLALDKVIKQGLQKVIIAIPQLSIGSSFADTNLTDNGFFADWKIDNGYNLCLPGGDSQKVDKAVSFLGDPKAHYLLCSHQTLTFFYAKVQDKHAFDHCLVAVDEFHHVSEDAENRLGTVIHSLMEESSAHIVAMTGSYFRGDSVPVLSPEDENRFDRVTYTYYEQLNGYKYLKSLGIDYAFYSGRWIDAVPQVLDLGKKTILHIPNVNSRESTGDKLNEVNTLFDLIGKVISRDDDTGIYTVMTHRGRILHIAELVNDTNGMQGITQAALRRKDVLESLDLIIALGMAKEGFDWPQCEVALTAGYRASLTEIVQIIGRATRDYPGKTHARFINLLAQPNALLSDVEDAVNSLLKAITLSLLMEQVLAPNVHFRKRGEKVSSDSEAADSNTIVVNIDDENVSPRAMEVANNEGLDIIEKVLNSSNAVKSAMINGGEGVNQDLVVEDISDIIRNSHPELEEHDIEAVAKAICTHMILSSISHGENNEEHQETHHKEANTDSRGTDDSPDLDENKVPSHPYIEEIDGGNTILNIGGKFINLDELDFNMIESINPFAGAYNFVSKAVDSELLKRLKGKALAMREKMTEQKALALWAYIQKFVMDNKREPDLNSNNDFERRLAVALAFLKERKRMRNAKNKVEGQQQ